MSRYVRLEMFVGLVGGYSVKAIRHKIEDGVWVEGREFRKAPDGRIFVDMEGFYKWVEGQPQAV